MRKALMWWAGCALGGLLLVAHFSLVLLSMLPPNPIKTQLGGVIAAYVNPLFSQSWSFFAQPLDVDYSLYVRGRFVDDRTGREAGTAWINVSAPLLSAVRRDRWSPLQLINQMVSHAVLDYTSAIADDPRASFSKDGITYMRPIIPATLAAYPLQALERTGQAALEMAYPGRRFTAVQIGIATHVFPGFAQRFQPDTTAHDTFSMVQWQPAFPVETF